MTRLSSIACHATLLPFLLSVGCTKGSGDDMSLFSVGATDSPISRRSRDPMTASSGDTATDADTAGGGMDGDKVMVVGNGKECKQVEINSNPAYVNQFRLMIGSLRVRGDGKTIGPWAVAVAPNMSQPGVSFFLTGCMADGNGDGQADATINIEAQLQSKKAPIKLLTKTQVGNQMPHFLGVFSDHGPLLWDQKGGFPYMRGTLTIDVYNTAQVVLRGDLDLDDPKDLQVEFDIEWRQ